MFVTGKSTSTPLLRNEKQLRDLPQGTGSPKTKDNHKVHSTTKTSKTIAANATSEVHERINNNSPFISIESASHTPRE